METINEGKLTELITEYVSKSVRGGLSAEGARDGGGTVRLTGERREQKYVDGSRRRTAEFEVHLFCAANDAAREELFLQYAELGEHIRYMPGYFILGVGTGVFSEVSGVKRVKAHPGGREEYSARYAVTYEKESELDLWYKA